MIAALAGRLFYFFMPGGVLLLVAVLFGHSAEVVHWRPVPEVGLPVRDAVAVLMPLNLAWLALSREKGLVNPAGLTRLLLIFSQPPLIAALYLYRPELLSYLSKDFLSWNFAWQLPLAQPAIAAYILVLALLILNFSRQRGVIDAGFIWALLAGYLGLVVYTGLLSTICIMLGGLILVTSVIEAAHTMAFRDELTGLPGRRALDELLARLRGDYVVAMLDIDFFKKFNDRYGHDVGDQVLKMVAAHIAGIKGGGRPFRYGGEEFTVVFPGSAIDEVADHLERVRESVAEAGFTLRNSTRPKIPASGRKGRGRSKHSTRNRVGVTISIGAASRDERRQNPGQVLKKADQALYKAKKAGRNRVIV
ncbi:MAG: GGDEF domain-containing protein [Desulfobulbaceae bacterium]|nr:GGDEF domain-containing protein [Desulfobulbaceae bacterium]